MRMTYGKLVRRCVVDIRVGTRHVRKVMYRGPGEDEARQIWPDGEGAVTGVGLDLAPVAEGEAGAYWRHALGVLFGDAEYAVEEYHVFIVGEILIGGQWFTFGMDETREPGRKRDVAGYENGMVTLAGAQIPPESLHVGSEVLVRVLIPEHYSRTVSSNVGEDLDELLDVPWLDGSCMEGKVHNVKPETEYLKGVPSGDTYISHHGGSRILAGMDNFTSYPAKGFKAPAGDTGLRIVGNFQGRTLTRDLRVKFPYFFMEFVFKVTAVVRHG